MRLLYVFPRTTPNPEERAAEHARRLAILRAVASPSTEVDIRELEGAPPAIESVRDGYAVAPGIIALAESLQHEYDAIIVGCFGDPAVDGAIEGTNIPIVGCALPSMATSLLLGQRFAVLSPTTNAAAQVRTFVLANGLIDRFAGAVPVGLGVREFAVDPARTLQAVTEAGHRALALGADVLILGCLSLAFTDAGDALQERLGVPIVNPLRVAVRTCELLVGSGLRPSKRFASQSATESVVIA